MPAQTTTRNLNVPWLVLVMRADPDFQRDKRNEVEYEFSNGRNFSGNPTMRGAYAPPSLDFSHEANSQFLPTI